MRGKGPLNPALALTDRCEDERVRSIVRARLGTGVLWPMKGQVHCWAGYGCNQACVVCGASIGGAEVEYQVEAPDGRQAVAHLVCFMIWQSESDR